MSLIRQFAGQTIIYGIGHIFSRILYFLVLNTYLTYKLDDTYEYGLYGIMYGWATLGIVLLSYRMDTAFFRFGSKEGKMSKAFSAAFLPLIISTVVIATLGIFNAEALSQMLDLAQYPHYFKWFVAILAFDVLALLPFAKLRLEKKPKQFMLFKVFNILLTILFIFYFLEFYIPSTETSTGWLHRFFPVISHEVDYVFIANLMASAIQFFALCFTLKGIKLVIDWTLWKKMFWYAAPLIIVGVANSINQFFSAQLQQQFLPGTDQENIAQSGIYQAAMRIAALLVMFNTAFNYAAEPFFFSNASNKNDKDIYRKVLKLYTIAAVVASVLMVYSLDILQYLIAGNYREAIFIIPILLFAFIFLGMYYNVSIWYKLSDKTIYGSIISIIGAIITLSLSYHFLPRIGYVASAWAALSCYGAMVILALLFGRKHYPIAYDLKSIVLILLAGVLMILINIFLINVDLGVVMLTLLRILLVSVFLFGIFRSNKSLIMELFRKS